MINPGKKKRKRSKKGKQREEKKTSIAAPGVRQVAVRGLEDNADTEQR